MNVPPFKRAGLPVRGSIINDTLTRRGAEAIAREIRFRWNDAGYNVNVRVEREDSVYCVRSNLVNGLPPRDAAAKIKLVVW